MIFFSYNPPSRQNKTKPHFVRWFSFFLTILSLVTIKTDPVQRMVCWWPRRQGHRGGDWLPGHAHCARRVRPAPRLGGCRRELLPEVFGITGFRNCIWLHENMYISIPIGSLERYMPFLIGINHHCRASVVISYQRKTIAESLQSISTAIAGDEKGGVRARFFNCYTSNMEVHMNDPLVYGATWAWRSSNRWKIGEISGKKSRLTVVQFLPPFYLSACTAAYQAFLEPLVQGHIGKAQCSSRVVDWPDFQRKI